MRGEQQDLPQVAEGDTPQSQDVAGEDLLYHE
jgi:hypothetical protein